MSFNPDKRNIQKNYPQKKRKKTNNYHDTEQKIVGPTLVPDINNGSKEIKPPSCMVDKSYKGTYIINEKYKG
jgi:hypothetical protein